VNNHPKAQMEFTNTPEVGSLDRWIRAVDTWARSQGYTGPGPF